MSNWCLDFQITSSPCLPPFSPATWAKNGYPGREGSLVVENVPTAMNIAPKSPLFRMVNEKLKLEDDAITSFQNFNANESSKSCNYTNSHASVNDGGDAPLQDIKLSDFDLDFDVWNTVIDETQEESVSIEDRFSSMISEKLVPSLSTISSGPEQFTLKTEGALESTGNEEKGLKMEENEMDMGACKNETLDDYSTIQNFPNTMQNGCNSNSDDSLNAANNFNLVQSQSSQYNSTNECVAVTTTQQESLLHPHLNQKQLHRIKVNFSYFNGSMML